MGLVPGLIPPTSDTDLTFALGVICFIYFLMFADHHVLTLFTGLTYVLIPIAFYALGSIVCIVRHWVSLFWP